MATCSNQFLFGAATAAYQVEGAVSEGGRTPSIWDTFSHTPGCVTDGTNGDVACDHYHRWQEDIALMEELGLDAYRFSIAWPRIFPRKGEYNPQGMAFYKELCTALRAKNIQPCITLYHWDLPQWAQDLGGWGERACVDWFLEYARKCFEELDGLASLWITFNEPWCSAFLGNHTGRHAPGHRDLAEAVRAAHHLLLAHGRTVQLYRQLQGAHPIGITLNLNPSFPATDRYADQLAADLHMGHVGRWFLDPLFKKTYPADLAALYGARAAIDYRFVLPGDFAEIAAPCDFLGVNYYNHNIREYDSTAPYLSSLAYTDRPKTDMGWDISPEALPKLAAWLRQEYTSLPLYITENGVAFRDQLSADGQVHDPQRCDYLRQHLEAVEQCNRQGLDIRGYFCWSLLDNFEWGFGFSKRFGLVYLDYETQRRIKKDSFAFYRDYIRAARG